MLLSVIVTFQAGVHSRVECLCVFESKRHSRRRRARHLCQSEALVIPSGMYTDCPPLLQARRCSYTPDAPLMWSFPSKLTHTPLIIKHPNESLHQRNSVPASATDPSHPLLLSPHLFSCRWSKTFGTLYNHWKSNGRCVQKSEVGRSTASVVILHPSHLKIIRPLRSDALAVELMEISWFMFYLCSVLTVNADLFLFLLEEHYWNVFVRIGRFKVTFKGESHGPCPHLLLYL